MPKNNIFLIAGTDKTVQLKYSKIIFCHLVNNVIGKTRLIPDPVTGMIKDRFFSDNSINPERSDDSTINITKTYGIKLHSVLDPVKIVANTFFGIENQILFSSEKEWSNKTHVSWENIPPNIRTKYSRPKRGSKTEYALASGHMTVCELLEVLNEDIFMAIDENAMSRSLFELIAKENNKFSIIWDSNDIINASIGEEYGAISFYLYDKNPVLHGQYSYSLPINEFTGSKIISIVDKFLGD